MDILKPEDYQEPVCLLDMEPGGAEERLKPVPQRRIIEKMDEYMSRRDYAGAERHLLYWLGEAKLGGDIRGELMLRGELVGHYRKTGEKEKAFEHAEETLRLVALPDFAGTVSAGTAYVNVATAYHAFGRQEEALALFEKAKAAYEANPRTQPQLLGGLYNNMALAYAAEKQYEKTHALYDLAMAVMKKVPDSEPEQAITCLNRADALEAELGAEAAEKQIEALLGQAFELLDTPSVPRDGYYAFVCEKCAPSFSYYGYFLEAEELKQRAERIYERN